MNSLSAIAGHEGDEEEWEREMRGIHNDDEVRLTLFYIPHLSLITFSPRVSRRLTMVTKKLPLLLSLPTSAAVYLIFLLHHPTLVQMCDVTRA